MSPPLSDSPIEDHLDGAIAGESLAKILIQIGMPARDDKQVPSHLLLGLGAGNCSRLRTVS
jgi:hypothetical protein